MLGGMGGVDTMSENEKEVYIKCPKCGEKIKVEECGNARGYGEYAYCERCDKRYVLNEVDLTREFY